MTRTYVKLHGAWSGRPLYIRTSSIISVGQNPEELSETLVTFLPGCTAFTVESPDEVMDLLNDVAIREDFDYEVKRAARLAAIGERAAQKEVNA